MLYSFLELFVLCFGFGLVFLCFVNKCCLLLRTCLSWWFGKLEFTQGRSSSPLGVTDGEVNIPPTNGRLPMTHIQAAPALFQMRLGLYSIAAETEVVPRTPTSLYV